MLGGEAGAGEVGCRTLRLLVILSDVVRNALLAVSAVCCEPPGVCRVDVVDRKLPDDRRRWKGVERSAGCLALVLSRPNPLCVLVGRCLLSSPCAARCKPDRAVNL